MKLREMEEELKHYVVPKRMNRVRRVVQIARELTPITVKILRDKEKYLLFGGPRKITEEEEQERAEELADSLVNLGPTFIKVGQLLSTRPDILPKKYVEELSRLQDEVPPAPYSEVKEILKEEIGSIDKRFEDFNKEPIAGASLGQVYKARIDGSDVAVKVNRPNVQKLIDLDTKILESTIPFIKKLADPAKAYSMENIIKEFNKIIKQEMNYEREADYMDKIRDNFKNDSSIIIPRVKWSHTTKKILTMEYVDGVKIKKRDKLKEMGVDTEKVANKINQIYLKMVISDGVFQADPHPGNIAVTDDEKIVLYDYGMTGEIGPATKQKITKLYLSIARKDARGILNSLIDLGTLKPGVRLHVLERVTEKAIEEMKESKEWRAEELLEAVQRIIYRYPIRIPMHLAMLMRMVVIIEGECRQLEPGFNFVNSAKTYIKKQGVERDQIEYKIREDLINLEKSLDVSTKMPQKIDNIMDQLRRSEIELNTQIEDPDKVMYNMTTRLVFGMLSGASMIFTALAMDTSSFLTGVGIFLTFMFLLGFLFTSIEKEREPWEAKKQIF